MDTLLKAIAEPKRRDIIRLIWARELPATQIAEHFPEVRCEGRVFTISRPGLTVRANLSPVPAGGLKAFGWTVSQTR